MASNFRVEFEAYLNTAQIEAQIAKLRNQTMTFGVGGGKGKNGGVSGITAATTGMTALGEATKKTNQGFTTILKKVGMFGVATAVLGGVTKTIGAAVDSVTEFDKALTELKKVSSYDNKALSKYTNQLGELGQTVARTRAEMTEGATMFVKSGYTETEAKQLAKVAAMYQNVADAEISGTEASAFLISQMKAFRIETSDSMRVLDALNEVSNNYSVSSTDLASGLKKTASAFYTAGNTYEQTLGLITAGVETMPNQAGKVSRGIRTMAANITKAANANGKLSYTVDGTSKSISLLDETTGDMLSTYDVFGKISEDWSNMSKAEQTALGLQVAGKSHLEVFTATLNNFDTAVRATNTALNSTGSASKENSRYMESLEARVTKLKSAFQEMVLDSGLPNLVKGVIGGTTGAVSVFGAFDALPLKITAAVGALNLFSKGFKKLITTNKTAGLLASWANLYGPLDAAGEAVRLSTDKAKKGIKNVGTSLKNTGKYIKTYARQIGALSYGLTAFAGAALIAWGAYDAIFNADKNRTELVERYNKAASKRISNEEKIANIEKSGLDTSEQVAYLAYLKNVNEELERQEKIERERALSAYGLTDESVNSTGAGGQTKAERTLAQTKNDYEQLNKLIETNNQLQSKYKADGSNYKQVKSAIKSNNKEIDKYIANIKEEKALLESIPYNELTASQQAELDVLNQMMDAYKKYLPTEAAANGDKRTQAINMMKYAYDDLSDSINTAAKSVSALQEAMSNNLDEGAISSAYGDSITSALSSATGSVYGTNDFWEAAQGILSTDYLNSVNMDFSTVQAKLTEIQPLFGNTAQSAANFFNLMSSNSSTMSDFGVTIGKTADGLMKIEGIDSSNIADIANELGLSVDAFSGVLDNFSKYGDLVKFNIEDLSSAVDKLGGYVDETSGKTYVFGDVLKEAIGATPQEWNQLVPILQEMGVECINSSASAEEFANKLVSIGNGIGTINSEGQITLNADAAYESLQQMGFSAEQAEAKLLELEANGNVTLQIDGNNQGAMSKIIASRMAAAALNKLKAQVTITAKDNATGIINSVKSALASIAGKVVTTYINTVKNTTTSNGGGGGSKDSSGKNSAAGGESQGGATLVNEEGAELIYGNGRAFIAGGGKPVITNLNKGDYVYTAKETQAILKRSGKTTTNAFKSRASGTSAYSTMKDTSDDALSILEHDLKMLQYQNASTESQLNKIKEIQTSLNKYANEFRNIGDSDSLKEVRSLQEEWWSFREEYLKAIKEMHDNVIADLEHEVYISEKNNSSEIERIEILMSAQRELHEQAEYWRTIDTQDAIEKVRALQKEWWDFEADIEDLYEAIADKRKETLEEEMEMLELRQDVLEWYADQQEDAIDEKIDALKKEKKALEDRNDEEDRAIKLQQLEESLAKAKSSKVKVYRAGLGFVYESDVSAISSAQKDLDEYKSELDRQKELDAIQEKIDALEDEKDAWSDVVRNYKAQQTKLENELKLGMTYEEYILNQRIENVEDFGNVWKTTVDEIISKQKQLNDIEDGTWSAKAEATTNGITYNKLDAMSNYQVITPLGTVVDAQISSNNKLQTNVPVGSVLKVNGNYYRITGGTAGAYSSEVVSKDMYPAYASGTSGLSDGQFARINENGSELIVPSGLNYLAKGTGIVPHTLTDNLMALGQMGVSGIKDYIAAKSTESNNFNFDSLVLPNVNNADEFISELKNLKNFKNMALQKTYSRK